MISVGEDATASIHHAVHRTRQSGADRHHAASERVTVARLDDEVRVISLQCIVDEPKRRPFASAGERPLDFVDELGPAKGREAALQSHRHVRRYRSRERLSRAVRLARIRAGLPSGVRSTSAMPRAHCQRKLDLSGPLSHRRTDLIRATF